MTDTRTFLQMLSQELEFAYDAGNEGDAFDSHHVAERIVDTLDPVRREANVPDLDWLAMVMANNYGTAAVIRALDQHAPGIRHAFAPPRIAPNAAPTQDHAWRPIETAPKDGTRILLWLVHENAKYSKDPIGEGWVAPVIGSWTNHNQGGWTWHGMYGTPTHWHPLPATRPAQPALNRSVIVYGPSGCGKTTEAVRLAKYFGLSRIADGADLAKQPTHRGWDVDHLFLVRERPSWAPADDRRVIDFHDALALAKDAEA